MRDSKSAMNELALPLRACMRTIRASRLPPMCGAERRMRRLMCMLVWREVSRGKRTTSGSLEEGGGGGGGGGFHVAADHFASGRACKSVGDACARGRRRSEAARRSIVTAEHASSAS